ncbi:class I SAM-dependent methyltransferase [Oceanobacillus bengalensis]|uniref:Class I SAM-dependent methyltransferase n=1 Tax=Oceanobacillus bengalensis TaxID=1435466 RepID=A0A494YVV0_9BACI|nr:class I SAM-dependent methyltransferase [Oceanobacillus bengalensis]RKQ14277.1 class I SAM-dependent methyltransferase [Oceanobacillus bengalensis]
MSEHYFSQQPHSKSSPKNWDFTLRNKVYTFTSDVGVFSKKEVDYGSRLLIEKFSEPIISGDILDLGCGYGPIGITLADNFRNRKVLMVDINERAVSLADLNASNNKIENIESIQSDGFSNIINRKFAVVVTNPPIRAGKSVIYQMFDDSQKVLLHGGELWVVIQKKQGAPSALKKLEALFKEVEIVAKDKGYYLLKAKKEVK